MSDIDFVEIDVYINGQWVARRYPRHVAVDLYEQLSKLFELERREQLETHQLHLLVK